ncbi:MAG: transporter [Rhodobacteraceae bacterium]|nr:transporter [Paracoccaceae bacterium]
MSLRNRFIGFGLAVALGVSAVAAKAETLGGALAAAYENSGLLDQNRALLRAADEDVAQATASLMPIVGWSANISTAYGTQTTLGILVDYSSWSADLSLSAQMTLFDNGATQFAIEATKETVLGTRESLLNVEQQVLLRAVQAYLNVRSTAEFVALRESNVRVLTQEYRAAQDRFDVGEVTRTDVSQAEAFLAAARSLLSVAEGNQARAIEEYRAAIGRRPGTLDPAPAANITQGVEAAKAYAAQNHPAVRQVQHQVSAAEFGVRRAEAAQKPAVTLGGSLSVNDQGYDSGALQLSISGPVYQGGRLPSIIRQVMARRDAARAGLHVAVAGVQQNVGNAYANLSVARAAAEAYRRQIAASQVVFDGVREEAKLGARTTLDVLNAEQNLLDARANLVSAQADEVAASYAVLASLGLLTASHLGLAVQQYDPTAYYNLVKDAPTASSPQGEALDRVLQAIGQ